MPKRPAATKGFPRNPDDCFASRHLSSAQFKVYHVVRNCAWSWRQKKEGDSAAGPLIFNASVIPWLCNAVPISSNQARSVLQELVRLGWLILVRTGKNKQDGRQEPNTYRVLEHDEFVQSHPRSCLPNLYAPNFEEAEKYGVSYGEKLPPEQSVLPKNFWPSPDTPLGSAVRKLTAEEPGVFSEEESRALQADMAAATRFPVTADTTFPVTARDQKPVQAVTSFQSEPLPENSSGRYQVSGQNLERHLELHQHTHTQPAAIAEATPMADAKTCVGVLIEKFVSDEGQAPKLTTKQRAEMTALALQHGREKFLGAGDAWIKSHPWNSKTTDPFLSFISGFEGYVFQVKQNENEKELRAKADEQAKVTSEFSKYTLAVQHGFGFEPDFLATLTEEDRILIAKLKQARSLKDLPPNKDRIFEIYELQSAWNTECREKEEAEVAKAIENGDF